MSFLQRGIRAALDRFHGSLRARLFLPIAVLSTATLTAMVLAAVQIYAMDMERGAKERAALFATLAADGVTGQMLQSGIEGMPDMLKALKGHRLDVESVSIIRAEGVVALSSEPDLIGTLRWNPGQLARTGSMEVTEGKRFAVLRPLQNEVRCGGCHGPASKVNGWLDVTFSNAPMEAAKRRLMLTLAGTGLPSLVLLLAVTWLLLGRHATHPIQRLVGAMMRARSGEPEVRADEGRSDEIGVAARGFDATLQALRKSQAELEKAYETRMIRADRFATVGQMATGLAHEIKNPLAGLSGALELLAEDLAGSPKGEVVAEMQHQVTRLAQIMDGLLSYARPPKANLRQTDVNAVLEKGLFLVAQQRKSAVKVIRELDPALPTVRADASQLEQVFLNILLNASQAVNGSGGSITVRSSQRADRVVVEIADTGPGIPPEVRPSIFTPFFTTRANGTGLGLAISARLVAEHGGHIRFDCPPEGGTVFTVALPSGAEGAEAAKATGT